MSLESFISGRKQRDDQRFRREQQLREERERHYSKGLPDRYIRHEGRNEHGEDHSYETENPEYERQQSNGRYLEERQHAVSTESFRDDQVENFYRTQIRLYELHDELKQDKGPKGSSAETLEMKGFGSLAELEERITETRRKIKSIVEKRGTFDRFKISLGFQPDAADSLRKELRKLQDLESDVNHMEWREMRLKERERLLEEGSNLRDAIRRMETKYGFAPADLEMRKK